MDPAVFWALIEESRDFTPPDAETVWHAQTLQEDEQLRRLRALLSDLSTDQLLAFDAELKRQHARGLSWDLANVDQLLGGGGDDGFVYFRCWLIAQGREAFETITDEPDRIADHVPDEIVPQMFDGWEFCVVAQDLLASRLGEDAFDALDLPAFEQDLPMADRYEIQTDAEVAERFPDLAARLNEVRFVVPNTTDRP